MNAYGPSHFPDFDKRLNTIDQSQFPLPDGIRSRSLLTESGLTQHLLESGDPSDPTLLLLHGFPELAYSWRKVMVPLADAKFHVVAPDQRGYGRTTGWVGDYDNDLSAFSLPSLVRDALALLRALNVDEVSCVIGHDFGSPVAAYAAMMRPDVFKRLICMSAPFGGAPRISNTEDSIQQDLRALNPPRKHYQHYYSTREAADDMLHAPQSFHAFLRAYYHMKSADWAINQPHVLESWSASELAKMPNYYIMHASETMAETVVEHDPGPTCDWLTDEELTVYTEEFERTGLQAALNWYRCGTDRRFTRDLSVFDGCSIDVPAMFVAGKQDWGWAQSPGALSRMESSICRQWRGTHLVEGAGHWVQQEQPVITTELILDFLSSN